MTIGSFVRSLLVVGAILELVAVRAWSAPPTITIGVAQLALEPTLVENRDKIIRFVGEAKSRGCRVVVFPETALTKRR